jgi:N-methylhydantoinase A
MTVRISTDVGRTFTDVVVVDPSAGTSVFKTPSTPDDPIEGVIDGLGIAADARGESLEALLGSCELLSHGSAVGTDALLQGRTPPVGLLCTTGHRDVLLWREGGKDDPFDWNLDYPEPFVPRSLTQAIVERMSPEGETVVPLDEVQAREAILRLRGTGVRSVAVAFLWSFENPAHELRVAELIAELWPDAFVSLSHQVNPVIREYRRTIDTCLDAALKPLLGEYVGQLNDRLRDEGLRGEAYLLTSSGGVTSAREMISRPAANLHSAPSLSHVGGRHFARAALACDDLVVCDIGGARSDVTVVTGGEAKVTRDWNLGSETPGYPRVDVRGIDACGGSIAWVDEGGLIRVGPENAGSRPGPACYGLGGELPTVTDAAVVLGYNDPDSFVSGTLRLNRDKAREALVAHIASPLGLDAEAAAFTVWNTACVTMTESVRQITSVQDVDPHRCVLVAGGGAAGAHIIPVAAALGVKAVVVPRIAGVLSAFGGVIADVVRDFNRAYLMSTEDFDFVRVQRVLDGLADEAHSFLDGLGVPREEHSLAYSVEARYPLQERELSVPLRDPHLRSDEEVARLVEDFHAIHEQVRGSKEPGQAVELVLWTLRATGVLPKEESALLIGRTGDATAPEADARAAAPTPGTMRSVFFAELGGMTDTPVFDGGRLAPNQTVEGPCIISEPTASLVVPCGVAVLRSPADCYVVEFGSATVGGGD